MERHGSEVDVRADITQLRAEHAADAEQGLRPPSWQPDSVAAYVLWLMDADRKSTGLKSLQGKIWEAGYRTGELLGQVFADVPPALARWRRQQRDVCIYSSGSVPAQQLLFSHSTAGDLTPSIRAYFDTTSGPKTEPDSYRRIAGALERSPSEMLFVSDVVAELDAARQAGMGTALCVRSSEAPANTGAHPVVHTFDELLPG